MSKSVVAFVAITCVCGTASAYLWQELREERAQTQALRTRVEQLEQAQIALAARGPQPTREIASAPISTPTPVEAQPTPAPKAIPAKVEVASATGMVAAIGPDEREDVRRRRMHDGMEQQRKMLQDPEYRSLMREQHKLGMRRMYADMEMMMGLSKEEADKIRDLLAEQQIRSMEHPPAFMSTNSGKPDQAAIREQQRYYQEVQRKNEAEIRAALGSKYSEWQDYQKSMGARSQVMRLRESLSLSDEPLRQDQLKPLVQAIAREQEQLHAQPRTGGWAAYGRGPDMNAQVQMQEEWLARTTQSHERIRNAASSLLTSAQMAQLEQQQELERRQLELSVRQMRARAAEAAARGEDPMQPPVAGVSNSIMIAN